MPPVMAFFADGSRREINVDTLPCLIQLVVRKWLHAPSLSPGLVDVHSPDRVAVQIILRREYLLIPGDAVGCLEGNAVEDVVRHEMVRTTDGACEPRPRQYRRLTVLVEAGAPWYERWQPTDTIAAMTDHELTIAYRTAPTDEITAEIDRRICAGAMTVV